MEPHDIIPLNTNNRDNSLFCHLKKVIGRGAFGDVYEAIVVGAASVCRLDACGSEKEDDDVNQNQDQKQNVVAVKTSQSGDDLAREAQVLSRLNHPHVIKLLFFLTNKEAEKEVTHGLVLEYLEGPDLFQLVSDKGNIPESRAASYADSILSALRYLGRSKVTHGDVSLYNMVLNGPARGIKLVDFGCARVFESHDCEGLRLFLLIK